MLLSRPLKLKHTGLSPLIILVSKDAKIDGFFSKYASHSSTRGRNEHPTGVHQLSFEPRLIYYRAWSSGRRQTLPPVIINEAMPEQLKNTYSEQLLANLKEQRKTSRVSISFFPSFQTLLLRGMECLFHLKNKQLLWEQKNVEQNNYSYSLVL